MNNNSEDMYDVITFGSATQDVFMSSRRFRVVEEKKFITKKGLCVPLGSKMHMESVFFAMGGCGANTAVTFANQGLKVAYCGQIDKDAAGQEVKETLTKHGVSLEFLKETTKWQTAYSVIISLPGVERSILEYLGACHYLTKKDIPFNRLKTKWFYVGPLSGESYKVFKPIIDFAVRRQIKLAVNPGKTQLETGLKDLRTSLNKIDIFIVNQEEAAKLTNLDYQAEREIFRKLDKWIEGIVVMTKGPAGVMVSDGTTLYSAGIPPSGLIDRTGAGDAFGAGFVSGIINWSYQAKKQSSRVSQSQVKLGWVTPAAIEYAIQLATANATACIQKVGAVNGLLKKGQWGKWERVKVTKAKCC